MLPGATSQGRHNQPKRPRSSLKTKLKKSGGGLINPPAPSTGLRRSQLLSAAPARSGALENGAKTPVLGGGEELSTAPDPSRTPPPAAAAVIPELSFGLLTPVFGTSLPEQPGWGRGGCRHRNFSRGRHGEAGQGSLRGGCGAWSRTPVQDAAPHRAGGPRAAAPLRDPPHRRRLPARAAALPGSPLEAAGKRSRDPKK